MLINYNTNPIKHDLLGIYLDNKNVEKLSVYLNGRLMVETNKFEFDHIFSMWKAILFSPNFIIPLSQSKRTLLEVEIESPKDALRPNLYIDVDLVHRSSQRTYKYRTFAGQDGRIHYFSPQDLIYVVTELQLP
jgi:hypothetical protein